MKHPVTNVADVDALRYGHDGLIPVIAQDEATGAVLMLAYANREALLKSLETGRMTYWSRSRGALWTKGETSGHTQRVRALAADCDRDTVLAVVEQSGPACHEETATCFTHRDGAPVATALGIVDRVAADRKAAPEGRYTDKLLADPELAAAKVVEEADEVARVLRGEDNPDSLEHEAADLLYHLVVALRGRDVPLERALRELLARHSR